MQLSAQGTKRPVDMEEEFRLLTLQVIGEAILGLPYEECDKVEGPARPACDREQHRWGLLCWGTSCTESLVAGAAFHAPAPLNRCQSVATAGVVMQQWRQHHQRQQQQQRRRRAAAIFAEAAAAAAAAAPASRRSVRRVPQSSYTAKPHATPATDSNKMKYTLQVFPQLYLPVMEESNRRVLQPWREWLPTPALFLYNSRMRHLNSYILGLLRKRWAEHKAGAGPAKPDVLERILAAVQVSCHKTMETAGTCSAMDVRILLSSPLVQLSFASGRVVAAVQQRACPFLFRKRATAGR